MTVDIDQHSGFCAGVTGAIRQAEQQLQQGPLCCLGDIVHNSEEVARLEDLGLCTIDYDDLRTMHGGRVLLRAHGEPPSTYWIARRNGVEVVDATCPVVKRLQQRIRACYQAHRDAQIVLYGQRGHAEVIGLVGQTCNTAIVIEHLEEADALLDYGRPIFLFAQTTKSVEGLHALAAHIGERCRAEFEWHDTICRSVANRVKNMQAFAASHDRVIFVGGRKSSNAKVLFQHCLEANPATIFVSSPDEVDPATLRGATSVGICGATSTPLWLMEQLRQLITYNL